MDVATETSPPGDRLRRRAWRDYSRPATWPWWLHRTFTLLSPVVLALAGAWIALAVAGTTQAYVGPLAIDVAFRPTLSGESVIHLDPVGAVVLDTHSGPVTLDISVRQVDLDGLSGYVDNPYSLSGLDDEITAGIQDVLVDAAIRAALTAVIGGTLAAALVLRSVRRTALAAGVATAAVLGSYGLTALTFDSEAVREPAYTGPLAAAPQLIGNAEDIATNFDAYADQLAGFVANVAAVYDTTLNLQTFQPNDDTIRVLHVSDLHLNPAAWDIIDAVAEQYAVDVIVDSGDIVDQGTPLESSYVRPIADLGRPYVFVKGNHDSVATAAAVAAAPNAVVLDGEPAEVAGLRFLGAPDPRFTPDKSVRGVPDEVIREGTEEFADAAEDLEPPPDVIVYHDPSHAELFDGIAPLVLSGHAHKRDTYVLDEGTRVMVQGSTGGAGLRGLRDEDPTPVNLSVLYFDPETKALVAWDDLTLGGLGQTSAEIDRHQAGEDDGAAQGPEDPSPAPDLEN
ncbi:metallophosphoesterase [Jiangella aurantiaca]|uniref:Metallophosphoesterase n=1 Tax=Jiangella aurantiaca TaxID=2530373 RepID=A0A4R5A3U2_9ACTN|nr:metallophosphoesterase [Jiangella aurantiaca]TDD65536.1 metallophosphoesterase [Jiangella aurantiaca]